MSFFFKWLHKLSGHKYYNIVCELWNKGDGVSEIAEKICLDRHTVTHLLELSTYNNNSSYSIQESINRGRKITGSKRSIPIACTNTGHCFKSISLCDKLSEEIFGVKLTNRNMSRQIKRKSPHKGLLFEYISKEEFNKRKQESPELCFGDSFSL